MHYKLKYHANLRKQDPLQEVKETIEAMSEADVEAKLNKRWAIVRSLKIHPVCTLQPKEKKPKRFNEAI